MDEGGRVGTERNVMSACARRAGWWWAKGLLVRGGRRNGKSGRAAIEGEEQGSREREQGEGDGFRPRRRGARGGGARGAGASMRRGDTERGGEQEGARGVESKLCNQGC